MRVMLAEALLDHRTTGTGSHVGGPEMAPKSPTLGSALAEPWRSSKTADKNSTARCSAQGRSRHGGPSQNPTGPPCAVNSATMLGESSEGLGTEASGTNGPSTWLLS